MLYSSPSEELPHGREHRSARPSRRPRRRRNADLQRRRAAIDQRGRAPRQGSQTPGHQERDGDLRQSKARFWSLRRRDRRRADRVGGTAWNGRIGRGHRRDRQVCDARNRQHPHALARRATARHAAADQYGATCISPPASRPRARSARSTSPKRWQAESDAHRSWRRAFSSTRSSAGAGQGRPTRSAPGFGTSR
jgi:hypothetical protein